MAHQPRAGQVHGEPRVAGLAGRDPAAAAAEHRRRVAAPVQEHQHLPAVGEVALDRGHRGRRQPVARGVDAQVDDGDARLAGAAGALGQRKLRRNGRPPRSRATRARASRSRARPERRRAARASARGRGPSSGIPPAACRKQSCSSSTTTRPSAGIGVKTAERVPITTGALPERAPRARPRARAPSASEECSATTGAARRSRKRADELRRQRDLRHQHERAAARREHALDEAQVHLGLAAAGDAVQEKGAEAARASRRSAATAAPWSAVSTGPGRPAPAGGGGAPRANDSSQPRRASARSAAPCPAAAMAGAAAPLRRSWR